MPKMPCHISDGPQEPGDELYSEGPDEDQLYEEQRQQEIDDAQPHVYYKTGRFTGSALYSCDKAYWWSTKQKALEMYERLARRENE